MAAPNGANARNDQLLTNAGNITSQKKQTTMQNRAQVTQPYTIDMFTALQPGTLVTFEESTQNFFKVLPDGCTNEFLIIKSQFTKHFKYYIQATIF